jgi:hypothetical protein
MSLVLLEGMVHGALEAGGIDIAVLTENLLSSLRSPC